MPKCSTVSDMIREISYAVVTHQGKIRENNEDNFYVQGKYRADVAKNEMRFCGHTRPEFFLAAVCDGMGGEEHGEMASLIAVETLVPHRYAELPEAAIADIQRANEKVCNYIMDNGGKRSGTTLAALYIDKGMAFCCNVGDSRIYRYRDGHLERLSKDHSRAQHMIDMGVLTKEQAKTLKDRHVLLQYLGIFPDEMIIEPWVEPSILLAPGDIFLLCSDGLTDMLGDEEIARILESNKGVARQADSLVNEALDAGGRDNVTVVIIRIDRRRWGFAQIK